MALDKQMFCELTNYYFIIADKAYRSRCGLVLHCSRRRVCKNIWNRTMAFL